MLIYVAAWIPMVAIGIANGTLREKWYGRHMSGRAAHQVSTLSAIVLLGGYMRALLCVFPPASSAQAGIIGLVWLVLTVLFEFLFGHYVARHPWRDLLHDYNLLAGRLWMLVLIWIAAVPYLFYRFTE